ncbi:MAG: chromosomal replication initiator protein DnaA [Clostridia bacterium]
MPDNFINIWEKVLEILKQEITPVGYKTYVEVMIPRIVDEHTICLLAPSKYHIDIFKNKYLDLVQNSLDFVSKKRFTITFEFKELIKNNDELNDVDLNKINNFESNNNNNNNNNNNFSNGINNTTNNDFNNTTNNATDNKVDSNLNPKYTFESFIVGSSNRFAHAAARSILDNLGNKYNPLYIYGGVGIGKTHLMQAIGNHVKDNNKDLRVIYVTGETFANELVYSLMNNKNEEFRNKYRNIDLLLLDDVQFLAGKEKCQEEFFHTFNSLFETGKQIVLTSEKSAKEINLLEDRLKTRFEMGLAVDIQSPDYETRLAILRKKTETERYIIDDDVLVKVATKVKSNVRELEGVFNKLIAVTSFTNTQLTDTIVDNTIESILVKNSKILTSKLIMQVVSKFFNVKVSDLTSTKRSNSVTYPRQVAMYICREYANLSFPEIGRDFGGRDHSTVLHSYGKIKEEFEGNGEVKNIIAEIKKLLSINE